ncbi:MAG: hypothetical protein AAF432_03220 [Planctomycetota bacterium]
MMFMVIFGALAAAMAVVAQGNLRTAHSSLEVSRAMSAAEAGLVFAMKRLESEAQRFVIEKGVVDASYANDLWLGDYNQAADGIVQVLDPDDYTTTSTGDGLIHAMYDVHAQDAHSIDGVLTGDTGWPAIDSVTGTLRVKAIKLTSQGANGPYFVLKYEPILTDPYVRVTSMGVDGNITRTLQMDFRIGKKIEFALLSPNRIMIGKNVRVEGPVGTRYGVISGELDGANGDPLVLESDFYYLSSALDSKLDTFFAEIQDHDVDGDNRLRPGHTAEALGLTSGDMVDNDGNEYVDDFDLFLGHYDANDDGMVLYDTTLAAAAGITAGSLEFDADLQLARLIDEALPDRDGDGDEGTASDIALGYQDGVVDGNDLYAKVRGALSFAVSQASWEAAHGDSYQSIVNGPVSTDIDDSPIEFDVDAEDLRELTTDMFNDAQNYYDTATSSSLAFGHDVQADPSGAAISGQVAASLNNDPGATFTAPNTWEGVPFGSQGAYDYYQRPIYENMTFSNVRIPMGNNGLFINCTFKGITYIESYTANDHHHWNLAGALEEDAANPGTYVLRFEDLVNSDPPLVGATPVTDTRPYSNNIRFDGCTFIGSVSSDKPTEYTHWRNKLQFTGNTRFYIDVEDPDLQTQTDVAEIKSVINGFTGAEIEEMEKSSILMPGWSLDVGNFGNVVGATPDQTPTVNLKGVIVAGVLDIRGTADVFGTVLMTYRPTANSGPLYYGGQTEAFNTTIGYFDPTRGGLEGSDLADIITQGFGEISIRYNPDALLPDGIPWPINIEADTTTYFEGGSL